MNNTLKKKIVDSKGKVEYLTIEELLEKSYCKKAIKAFARNCNYKLSWTQNGYDIEDYEQLAIIEIAKLFDIYDEVHSFSALMNVRFDQYEIFLARKYGNQKRGMANKERKSGVVYTSVNINDVNEQGDSLEDIIGKEDKNYSMLDFKLSIEKCLNNLNKLEKEIFTFLINQNEMKIEFAERMQMSRPTLDKKIAELRRKLKKELAA